MNLIKLSYLKKVLESKQFFRDRIEKRHEKRMKIVNKKIELIEMEIDTIEMGEG